MNYTSLPWNFEAFRKFVTYKAVQNAAGIITLYDNMEIADTKRLSEFQNLLNIRSGLTWEPSRQNSEDVLYNSEGNVFRNKARVMTSLLLLNPFELRRGKIVASDFCKHLASGRINESQYYDFIISRYEFPHASYDENWRAWSDAGIKLKPFIFILQILMQLYEKGVDAAYLTVDEFARFAHPLPLHEEVESICNIILAYRKNPDTASARLRTDKIDRKIGDVFGFMCMSKYTYYDGSKMRLNLRSRHPEELVNFHGSRGGVSVPDEIKKMIKEGLHPNV